MSPILLCLILAIVCFVLTFLLAKADSPSISDTGAFSMFMAGLTMLAVCFIFCTVKYIAFPRDLDRFVRQKAIIESAERSQFDATGIIELNDWLINKQYHIKRFGNWTIYPKELLDMKPIQ